MLSNLINGEDVEIASSIVDSRKGLEAEGERVEARGIDDNRLVRSEQEAIHHVPDFTGKGSGAPA